MCASLKYTWKQFPLWCAKIWKAQGTCSGHDRAWESLLIPFLLHCFLEKQVDSDLTLLFFCHLRICRKSCYRTETYLDITFIWKSIRHKNMNEKESSFYFLFWFLPLLAIPSIYIYRVIQNTRICKITCKWGLEILFH